MIEAILGRLSFSKPTLNIFLSIFSSSLFEPNKPYFFNKTTTENRNSLPCNKPAAKSPNYPVSNTEKVYYKGRNKFGGKIFPNFVNEEGEEVKKQKLVK